MSVCFQLCDKQTGEIVPLQTVDDRMREHFGAPADPINWFEGWYDTVGLMLACGKSLDWIRKEWPHRKAICDWLEANYSSDCWAER